MYFNIKYVVKHFSNILEKSLNILDAYYTAVTVRLDKSSTCLIWALLLHPASAFYFPIPWKDAA